LHGDGSCMHAYGTSEPLMFGDVCPAT
jgi:hypothetical protein